MLPAAAGVAAGGSASSIIINRMWNILLRTTRVSRGPQMHAVARLPPRLCVHARGGECSRPPPPPQQCAPILVELLFWAQVRNDSRAHEHCDGARGKCCVMGLRAVLLWGAGVGAVAAIVRKLKNDGTIDAALERIAFQVALATRASRGCEGGARRRWPCACRRARAQGAEPVGGWRACGAPRRRSCADGRRAEASGVAADTFFHVPQIWKYAQRYELQCRYASARTGSVCLQRSGREDAACRTCVTGCPRGRPRARAVHVVCCCRCAGTDGVRVAHTPLRRVQTQENLCAAARRKRGQHRQDALPAPPGCAVAAAG